MCLERGTMVILGAATLAGTVLGYTAAPVFLLIPALAGIHLIQFPYTGFCPLNAYIKEHGHCCCCGHEGEKKEGECCGNHDKKEGCCHHHDQ